MPPLHTEKHVLGAWSRRELGEAPNTPNILQILIPGPYLGFLLHSNKSNIVPTHLSKNPEEGPLLFIAAVLYCVLLYYATSYHHWFLTISHCHYHRHHGYGCDLLLWSPIVVVCMPKLRSGHTGQELAN